MILRRMVSESNETNAEVFWIDEALRGVDGGVDFFDIFSRGRDVASLCEWWRASALQTRAARQRARR